MISRTRRVRRALLPVLVLVLVGGGVLAGVRLYWDREFRRAQAEDHLGHTDAALAHVRHCLAVRPNHVPSLLLEARLLRLAGEFDSADQVLHRVRAVQGETTDDIQLEFVLLRAQRGEFDEVEAGLWQCLIQGHARSPAIAEAMATVYIARLQLSPAFMLVNKWIELDPENPKAWDWLGWLNENLQHLPSAQAAYRKAGELDPTRIEARVRTAGYTLLSGDAPTATREFEPLFAAYPDNPAVRVGYAKCLMRDLARVDEARAVLTETLRMYPDDLEANMELGNLELDFGTPVAAERLLRKAKQLDPNNPNVLAQLAAALRKQPGREAEYRAAFAEAEEARDDYIRFTQLVDAEGADRPKDTTGRGELDRRVELARFLFKLKRDPLGVYWAKQALAMDSQNRPAHKLLYEHYLAAGDQARAAEHKAFLGPADAGKP